MNVCLDQQVSKFFPALYIFKKGHGVFLNLQEFLYYPGALELLLSESKETVVDLECQQKMMKKICHNN